MISKYNGSPSDPGSLVRSNTAILLTVAGKTVPGDANEDGKTDENETVPLTVKVTLDDLGLDDTDYNKSLASKVTVTYNLYEKRYIYCKVSDKNGITSYHSNSFDSFSSLSE